MLTLTGIITLLWAEVPPGTLLSLERDERDVTRWIIRCGGYRLVGTVGGACTVNHGQTPLITYPFEERLDMIESLLAVVGEEARRG